MSRNQRFCLPKQKYIARIVTPFSYTHAKFNYEIIEIARLGEKMIRTRAYLKFQVLLHFVHHVGRLLQKGRLAFCQFLFHDTRDTSFAQGARQGQKHVILDSVISLKIIEASSTLSNGATISLATK